jgi:hypothetical protein
MVPVLLDRKCENAVVWRPCDLNGPQQSDLFVENGEISFSRVYAKSGSGREINVSNNYESPSSEDENED